MTQNCCCSKDSLQTPDFPRTTPLVDAGKGCRDTREKVQTTPTGGTWQTMPETPPGNANPTNIVSESLPAGPPPTHHLTRNNDVTVINETSLDTNSQPASAIHNKNNTENMDDGTTLCDNASDASGVTDDTSVESAADQRKIIEVSSPVYDYVTRSADTKKMILTQTSTEVSAAETEFTQAELMSQQKYYEMLRWPIILKPKLDQTCYDKKNNHKTSPIQVVNVTALYEVLMDGTSELDEYLTTIFLTSLDTYYKMYNFSFENYRYKNQYLNDILTYLLSFNRRTDIEENVRTILRQISFTNDDPLRFSYICNKRVYDELPKPKPEKKSPKTEIFFLCVSATPCFEKSNGVVSYQIGTSLDTDLPAEIQEALVDFLSYSNKHKAFKEVDWEKIGTREQVLLAIIDALRKGKIVNENQAQVIDYLTKYLKHDSSKLLPPNIDKNCVVVETHPQTALKFISDDVCAPEGFSNSFKKTYFVDVFSLFKALRSVEKTWMQKLIPLFASYKSFSKLNISYPLESQTKGELFREILARLAHEETIPFSMIQSITSEIDMIGYGSTPVETFDNCPVVKIETGSDKFLNKIDSKSCGFSELKTTTAGYFVHIPTLFKGFHKNTSKSLLNAFAKVLRQHAILPDMGDNYTNAQFLDAALQNIKNSTKFVDALKSQLNPEYRQPVVFEKMCPSAVNTNGEYLMYETDESCETRNVDVDISQVVASLDSDTPQNQIILLASMIFTRHRKFYEILSKTNVNKYEKTGDLLRSIFSNLSEVAEEKAFFAALLPHVLIEDSPPLTILTDCIESKFDLNEEELQRALEMDERSIVQPSYRILDDSTSGYEYKQLAKTGQRKLKESLYLLFGDKPKFAKVLNALDKTDIDTGRMYEGFGVIDELSDNYKVSLLLRRYYDVIKNDGDADIVEAVQAVLNALKIGTSKSKREIKTFDLEEMLHIARDDLPENIKEAQANLSIDLRNVTVGSTYDDVIPYLTKMEVLEQIPVLLKIVYEENRLTKSDLSTVIKIHNYFANEDVDLTDAETHYQRMIYLLHGFTANATEDDAVKAKDVVVGFLQKEKELDRGIVKLGSLDLKPKEYLIRSLRRFREISNKRSRPDVSRLWVATTKLLQYFEVPDHDLTENEVDEDLDVVGMFKTLDAEDQSFLTVKGTVLQYVIRNAKALPDAFKGLSDLENLSDRDMIRIVTNRLTKTARGATVKERKALDVISKHVSVGNNRGDTNHDDDLTQVIEKSFQNATLKKEKLAQSYLVKAIKDHSEIFRDLTKNSALGEFETTEQHLATLLRRLVTRHKSKLGNLLLWAVNVTFDMLNTRMEDSSWDQFAGDFTPRFRAIITESLPKDASQDTLNIVTDVIRRQKINFLKGVELYKHERELQSRILVLRLKQLNDLNENEVEAVDQIWTYFDSTPNEVLDEMINETEKISVIFENVFQGVDLPKYVNKAKGVIQHYLSPGKKYVKAAFKGIKYDTSYLEVLEQIFNNILRNNRMFDDDVVLAIKTISEFLEIPVAFSEMKKSIKIQKITNSFQKASTEETKLYWDDVMNYAKNYPTSFDKIMDNVVIDEEDEADHLVIQALRAIRNYEMPLSSKFRNASIFLECALEKYSGFAASNKKVKTRNLMEPNQQKGFDEAQFEKVKEVVQKFLYLEGHD